MEVKQYVSNEHVYLTTRPNDVDEVAAPEGQEALLPGHSNEAVHHSIVPLVRRNGDLRGLQLKF